jgi:HD superfamily phosphohydrolase YqeK
LARDVFGGEIVTDAVCSAILCHTTGKIGMTTTDKMLFVADFTEAGRKYRSCKDIREYLHSECEKINKNEKTALSRLLNDTVKRIVGFTVTYLIEKGKPIDADMILTWNDIVSEN